MKGLGAAMVCMGLGLHFWRMYVLRSWWVENRLCTMGPFKWLRHPMYAAWISCVSLGFALYLNSWILLLWVVSLHPVWHGLATREESMMAAHFPEEYPAYAARTGRFVPRLWRR